MNREAVRIPRAHRVAYFEKQLRLHRNHPEFRLADEPLRRLIGFSCTCGGSETLIQISLASVRELMPQALRAFQNVRNQHMNYGLRQKKRRTRADKKARALLFSHLTKQQKWHYRAHGCIRFTGGDGHEYEIELNVCNNVYKLEDGHRKVRYCVVFKGHRRLPLYDLMLAQMVILKVNPDYFHEIAIKSEINDYRDVGAPLQGQQLEGAAEAAEVGHEGVVIRRNVQGLVERLQQRLNEFEQQRYTHPEANLRQQLQEVGFGRPEILMNDLIFRKEQGNDQAIEYDVPLGGAAYYLNWDDSIVATCGPRVMVPRLNLDDVDYAVAVIALLQAAACCTYDHYDQVLDHFRQYDLQFAQVLFHPDDEPVFVEWIAGARWVPYLTTDERVPRGKALCLTNAEFLGIITHWHANDGEPAGIGFCVLNNRGVVKLRLPPDEDDREDIDEVQVGPRRPEGCGPGPKDLSTPPLSGPEDLQGRRGRRDGRPDGGLRSERGEDGRVGADDVVREDPGELGELGEPGEYLRRWLSSERRRGTQHRQEVNLEGTDLKGLTEDQLRDRLAETYLEEGPEEGGHQKGPHQARFSADGQ